MLFAALVAIVGLFAGSAALTTPPAGAYYGSGDVMVWGNYNRLCWVRLTYGQNYANEPVSSAQVLYCNIATPYKVHALVNFGYWPWAVWGSQVFYPNTAYARLAAPGTQADGACVQLTWWDGDVSTLGCINAWT
jgi:hypothetical protein